MRVLIVDDDFLVRSGVEAFLEDEGFDIISAETSEEALELLPLNQIDAALVDLRLPGMDGAEFIISARKNYPNLKCLIYTGSTEFSLPESLKNLGMQHSDIYRKPLGDLSAIANALKETL